MVFVCARCVATQSFAEYCLLAHKVTGLAQAQRHRFRHMDLEHLEEILKETAVVNFIRSCYCCHRKAKCVLQTARNRMVVTDGVFSMDGDIAPLAAISELCRR